MKTIKNFASALFAFCLFFGVCPSLSAQGSLRENLVFSPSLEGNLLGDPATRNIIVYVPPGYDTSQLSYPVVYLLHPAGGSERFYPYNEFPPSYEASGIFTLPQDFPDKGFVGLTDSLIDVGDIEPVIIAMPNINTAYGGSFCINSVLNGNYEDYIIDEIVPYVDSKYRTLADRNNRAIAGISMGGFGAMYISMKHPDVFGLVASHSSELCIDALARASQPMIKMENPAGLIPGPDPAKPFTSFMYLFSAAYSPNLNMPPFYIDIPFDDTCGIREDVLLKWAAYDPIQMFPGHMAALQSLKGIYLDVGDKDELQSSYFMAPFSAALTSVGIPHFFEVFDGMHYSNLYTRLSKSLKYLSDSLEHKSKGPTAIPGGNVSGTWTLSGSPYMINGEISVPDGLSLSIEPGVVISFAGHYKMNVQGSLRAKGTARDSITFTAENHETGWHGIKFIDTPATNDSSIFEYCVFEYGKANTGETRQDRSGGALIIQCDKVRVSHCLFQQNMCYHPSRDGGAGGAMVITGSPLVEFCEFRENTGSYGSTLLIYFRDSDPLIRNNYIHHNDGHGTINIGAQAAPILVNNVIVNNHTDSHGHLHFADYKCDAILINNTIANNTCGSTGAAVFVNHGLAPIFINTIIYGNSPAQVHLEIPSSLDFYHCLIEGGVEAFAGQAFNGAYQNNIDTIPLFVDVSNNDYHLSNNSPCISAGVDSIEHGGLWSYISDFDFDANLRPFPEGSAPDIGAFESILGHANISVHNEDFSGFSSLTGSMQCYPNPFDQSLTIKYSTPAAGWVSLNLINIDGREIEKLINTYQDAGEYYIKWQPENLQGGIYFLELETKLYSKTEKLIYIR